MKAHAILALAALTPLWAQEIKLPASLDKLAARAKQAVDVTLDANMLQLAARFLSARDPDEARVKELIRGLKGIYVKSLEFEHEGDYSPADVEAIQSQLRGPGWSRIVGVVSKKHGENADIYVKAEGDRVGGLVIVATEPRELTVVNIVGPIDLDRLSELGGHFGVPRVEVPRSRKKD